jgi:hypothetical protein
MNIYYPAFLEGNGYLRIGDYDAFRPEYPNGKADLRAMLARIKQAGITPGCHFLHSHLGRESRYVTPVPDHRLNLLRIFTLARPLGPADTTVFVEQNPLHATMEAKRRVLKIGTELLSYTGYTTTPPYAFTGCVRGIDRTTPAAQPAGLLFGLLDVSEFGATSVYIDQCSGLQDEIADQIADLWSAGFEFFYFDGSEGVNPPFWHHVANAQYRVFRKLQPQPLFAEGAAKTHFSWHMLTGGNAFDVFPPETIKEETVRHPLREAPPDAGQLHPPELRLAGDISCPTKRRSARSPTRSSSSPARRRHGTAPFRSRPSRTRWRAIRGRTTSWKSSAAGKRCGRASG